MAFNPYDATQAPRRGDRYDSNWVRTSGTSWMPRNPAPTPVKRTTTTTMPGSGSSIPSAGGSSGSVGAMPPRVPAPPSVGREADVSISPSATSLGQLDEAGRAAQSAVFGRAKDRAGQIASSALSGLRSSLAARGVLGSGIETQGTVDAAMQGAGILADTNREEAIQESQRGERAREFQTQAMLQQRGQNISQRGQDLAQILGTRGQDITQRGQDFTGRGQDITLEGLRRAAQGTTTTTEVDDPYAGDPYADPYNSLGTRQVRRY